VTDPAGPAANTVEVLAEARNRDGRSPLEWLAELLPASPGPVIEVSAPASDAGARVRLRRLDSGETMLGGPDALPLPENSAAGVRAVMCLPSVERLDELFAELRRVLRPAGTLVALVPSRPGLSVAQLRAWWPLERVFAQCPGCRNGFRNASARDHLGWYLAAADFAVLMDRRQVFQLPVSVARDTRALASGLVAAGVWPPGLTAAQFDAAHSVLSRHAASSRQLPIPLRLLVGRR
jgi:SAM-dependent methyltransferase